ncbi:MAG: DUF559 domain-containing protein [Chloroflexi bacterium]|nr:DUF559 domain-containing protein [Chloroflexota bacterium]
MKGITRTELVWVGKYDEEGNLRPVERTILPFQVVETINESKADRERIQRDLWTLMPRDDTWRNMLIWGDNKVVMSSLLPRFAGKINLIYIDPPFATGQDFSFRVRVGDEEFVKEPSIIEEKAYRDTWGRGLDSYLQMMYERLVLMRELLAEDGSIYIHLGADIAQYIKVVCDEIFGDTNFLNQVIWRFEGPQSPSPIRFATKHEVILRYAKSIDTVFAGDLYYGLKESPDKGRYQLDEEGRYFYTTPKGDYSDESLAQLEQSGRILRTKTGNIRIKHFLELDSEGDLIRKKKVPDVWDDIPSLGLAAQSRENTGFQTQKPERLLDRIIKASSREGDLVADFFCVRKGTRVWVPLPTSPVNGGGALRADGGGALRADGGGASSSYGGVSRLDVSVDSLPDASRDSLPDVGEGWGGVLIPIENLQPGDWVLAHDGQPHRVLRTIRKHHRGLMVGIRHNLSPQTLWVTGDHRVLCQKRTLSYGAQRTWKHIPQEHFLRSRELRKEMTAAEGLLWQALRGEQLGVKFRRQHPIGPYIADFYSWEAGLVIEVDGDSHFTPESQEYDAARTEYLEALGLNVVRVTNEDVFHRREAVLEHIFEATQEATPSEDHYCQWRRAATLKVGDIVFTPLWSPRHRGDEGRRPPVDGRNKKEEGRGEASLDVGEGWSEIYLQPAEIIAIEYMETEEEVYDLEVEGAHSFLTEVCAVHNCGSGTTLAVAEKLGRRWIGCDLSKWAIQVTRKRMLQIEGCKPFEILNLGNYERHKLAANGHWERYVQFILQLYRAEPVTGFKTLHGKKARAYVHVGSVDSPVTMREIRQTLKEAQGAGVREVHFLGWDFEMGLHDLVSQVGEDYGVKIRLVSIPREALEVTNPAKEELRFFDLNYLELEHGVTPCSPPRRRGAAPLPDVGEGQGGVLTVRLKDFIIANPEYLPDEVREKIKKFTDYIDYWAVDWDYKDDTFHNGWQSFRTRKNPKLETEATHTYEQPGTYKVLVKVVDIFGNDTTKMVEITIPEREV